MRLTNVQYAQHIARLFKWSWLIARRKKISQTNAKDLLTSAGIEVVTPQEIFTRSYPQAEPFQIAYRVPTEGPGSLNWHDFECCHIDNSFKPVELICLGQAQWLTNSVIRSSLPQQILEKVTETTPDEERKLRETVLHSNLLDAHQTKYPRRYHPTVVGFILPRQYGLSVERKNQLATYNLHLLLNQSVPGSCSRLLVQDTMSRVMVDNSDHRILFEMKSSYMTTSTSPLPPFADKETIKLTETETHPNIYPFSPFVHIPTTNTYKNDDFYAVPAFKSFPHTIYVHHDEHKYLGTEQMFYSMTLLNSFCHAAAFAKNVEKAASGDLVNPITIQMVHTDGRRYHLAAFQLNTLALNGTTKNIFWTQPWQSLFGSCRYIAAKPHLLGLNPHLLALLKAFHAQGI